MKKNNLLQLISIVVLAVLISCGEANNTNNENIVKDDNQNQPELVNETTIIDSQLVSKTKQPDEIPETKQVVEVLNIIDDGTINDLQDHFDCKTDEETVISIELVPPPKEEVCEEAFIIINSPRQEEIPIEHNTEEYSNITENEFMDVTLNPLSTFSIDVDNASYSNIRRYLNTNQLPPKGSVRIEEMINYFDYDYPEAKGEDPFNFITEVSDCPWTEGNKIVHIGIQGKKLDYDKLKPSNLVFLLDVSGSMSDHNKLPLLKRSFGLLLDQLDDKDKISIVVYAGAAGVILPPTPASEKDTIKAALNKLRTGGSTAGGAGILLAYKLAKEAYIKDGNNRIILATDGDFNVGVSSNSSLVELVEEKRKDDIYLTILGFGMGNYKDSKMEEISNAGNGNYFYIDNIKEAEKVFVKEMRANMFTIAKDVKIQIEFNPALVKAYRLIGYENRVLAKEDFNDDKKDAGELGAGHTVTALYEIIPAKSTKETRKVDTLKYQETRIKETAKASNEIMTLKFRYKPPKEETSKLIVHPVIDDNIKLNKTSDNFRFSLSVAGFGMLLRNSEFKGKVDYNMVEKLAANAKGKDINGYRSEYLGLVKTAKLLSVNL